MVATFSHIHHIVSVNVNTGGIVQLSIAFAFPPKLSQILSISCKYLNAVVKPVSHIHIPSAVECHIIGKVELSIASATAPKAIAECHSGQGWSGLYMSQIMVMITYSFFDH